MPVNIKKFIFLLVSLLAASCATVSEPVYFYNEVLIINKSKTLIQDVSISDSATGRQFSCGNIAPHGICSNRIVKRRYEKNPIRIAWVFGDTARQTSDFVLEVPEQFDPGRLLRGVLEISPGGRIKAYFQQSGSLE